MVIDFRQAEPEDALDISRIYAASWKTAYRGMVPQKYLDELKEDFWVEKFSRWLGEGTLKTEMLYEDKIPAGCVAYGKSRDEKLPDWGEIVSIYLHPNFYRRGFGTRLLSAATEDLKNQGYPACFLWVLKENLNAQKFYETNGFVKTDDTCNSEIMGKQLTDIRYVYSF